MTIYDPYYCQGAIKKLWRTHGIECINEPLDFYKREKHPKHDVLVTNPPFSDTHKERWSVRMYVNVHFPASSN